MNTEEQSSGNTLSAWLFVGALLGLFLVCCAMFGRSLDARQQGLRIEIDETVWRPVVSRHFPVMPTIHDEIERDTRCWIWLRNDRGEYRYVKLPPGKMTMGVQVDGGLSEVVTDAYSVPPPPTFTGHACLGDQTP